MLLLASIPKSITADVAMNVSVVKLKAARVMPRMAPPVPSNPAIIPDKVPPNTEFKVVGFIFSVLKIKKTRLVTIKNTANNNSRVSGENVLLSKPPIITNSTAGIPMDNTSFLLNPFLKKNILVILLETWKRAVIPSTE